MTQDDRKTLGLKTGGGVGLYRADKQTLHEQARELDISNSRMALLLIEAMNRGITVQALITQLKAKAEKTNRTVNQVIAQDLEPERTGRE
jgi:hypothetical protein